MKFYMIAVKLGENRERMKDRETGIVNAHYPTVCYVSYSIMTERPLTVATAYAALYSMKLAAHRSKPCRPCLCISTWNIMLVT